MIYKAIICFERIELDADFQKHSVDPVRGVWLQHNPPVNLLALLAVSRQVYDEARRVLYTFNSFVFHGKKALCVFLFGIGSHNASLLRSVKWKSDNGQYENHVDTIKEYMTQRQKSAQESHSKRNKLNIWNDDNQFVEFLKIIRSPGPDEWGHTHRLLRRDSEDVLTTDYFSRYIFNIHCFEGKESMRNARAAYELCSRVVKRGDPVSSAALRALGDEDVYRRDRERL
ncbi:uncharacterized protein TRUGW13939_08583 [Talaromyces rugulosus]|uniref:Uncharacterized protein n=1 Tax=Talaromyces rugulosus TaxID=121627 RepID=A0A7H8R761_TALRU|nr:uncharacterized protein TRUGW13939_08583 [Talaromyces rugulosus]QKX61435.1 hypothetical protein TRUGW13939_08583 [Talaromyces rugulosus]